jgi:3-oxoadipate enol-lactonase
VYEIMINGKRLAYTDDGQRDALALVFSHSPFFSSRMFHHQVAYFSDRYRVICYDHRG